MSVNTLNIEQANLLLEQVHKQATGQSSIQVNDLSSFISVATSTLATGYENTLNAISQVLSRTIVSVRPYTEKFKGLEFSTERWGGITRKINFADTLPLADDTYDLVEGESIDQYTIKKPDVLQTNYYGSFAWSGKYTITEQALTMAFENPQNFATFLSGLLTHFVNERTQWLENMKRTIIANAIGARNETGIGVVHLLTEYNLETGLSLTKQDAMKPDNFKPFMQWVYARVSNLTKLMTERSELFQQKIVDKPIMRHTPLEDQRVYMISSFLDGMDAQVLADAYHDNFLTYADVESVNFWQSIENPQTVDVIPTYCNSSGEVVVGTEQNVQNVVGIIFDRDAMGYNIFQNDLVSSPYNARGQYYNLYNHVRMQSMYDSTEKMIVLLMD